MPTIPELEAAVLSLSHGDREHLAQRLFISLEDGSKDTDYDDAWAAEIERRLTAIDSGAEPPLSEVEFQEAIRPLRVLIGGDAHAAAN